jgi:hypothetical protein
MVTLSVWEVLGLIALGMSIAEVYEYHSWWRYQQGKREGRDQKMKVGGR